MKKLLLIVIAMASMNAFAQTGGKASPGSLFNSGVDNPWLDRVARKEGDVLMVVIKEESTSSFSASTTATKDASNSVSLDVVKGFFSRLFGPLATSGGGTTSGSGNTAYNGKMAARMSVVVKKVLPNGQMVIEGTRTLVTNKETQTYVLSGLIRSTDIASDNSIDSTRIAEAEIKLTGTGMVAERQKKGIITQLLDWLF